MATKMVSTKLVLEAVGQRAVTEKLYLGASAGVAHIKTTLTNERFKLNSSATNLTWSLRAGFAINPKWYTEIQYRSFGKSAESIAAANNALEQAATNLVLGYRF